MTTLEPSNLALFWAGVIAVAILVYVILDGFDLGVGVLFGTTRQVRLRSQMIAGISPFWDGNEIWLVVIGASLYTAFPVVYAVFLPAFYIPVLLLLLGLIFRGVAFEFRSRGLAGGLWDWGFMIPYGITVGNAAAPEASLSFLFWGAGLFVLPAIAINTATVYWPFRGKSRIGYAGTPSIKVASGDRAPHRIIVVGGGAGGLELVTRLGDTLGRRGVADVTLIDKSRTHLWKPLLHEVAAGSMDFAVHEMDFAAQAHWHHFRYHIGEGLTADAGGRDARGAGGRESL
jgi:Cytochrome bd terminal oxidase subunit II